MSRDIHIGYQLTKGGEKTCIELRAPYFLFGTQRSSKAFWSLPSLRELGITFLTALGETDPICFVGWERMEELEQEIRLLQANLRDLDFNPELKAAWISHLIYAYYLLVQTAPRDSIPVLTIG